jgi:hypothetical protein
VEQEHRPEGVADRTYYEPSEHGREADVARRQRERRTPRGG